MLAIICRTRPSSFGVRCAAVLAAFVLGALGFVTLNASEADAQSVNCRIWTQPTEFERSVWPTSVETLQGGPWNMHRGPSASAACDRGADSYAGDRVRFVARSGDWVYGHNLTRNDWGWLPLEAVNAASGFGPGSGGAQIDCGKWLQPAQQFRRIVRPQVAVFTLKGGPWNMHRAPAYAAPCDRGADSYAGNQLRAHARFGDWFYVHNRTRNDWGWISAEAIDLSAGRTQPVNCQRWNGPKLSEWHGRFYTTVKGPGPWALRWGPSAAPRCDRGARSFVGDKLTVHGQDADRGWYYVHNTTRNTWGWIHSWAVLGF